MDAAAIKQMMMVGQSPHLHSHCGRRNFASHVAVLLSKPFIVLRLSLRKSYPNVFKLIRRGQFCGCCSATLFSGSCLAAAVLLQLSSNNWLVPRLQADIAVHFLLLRCEDTIENPVGILGRVVRPRNTETVGIFAPRSTSISSEPVA